MFIRHGNEHLGKARDVAMKENLRSAIRNGSYPQYMVDRFTAEGMSFLFQDSYTEDDWRNIARYFLYGIGAITDGNGFYRH